jgi:hypothetical protein
VKTVDPPHTWALDNTLTNDTRIVTLSTSQRIQTIQQALLSTLLDLLAAVVLFYTSVYLDWRKTIGSRLERHGLRTLQRQNLRITIENNERFLVRCLSTVIGWSIHPFGFECLVYEVYGVATLFFIIIVANISLPRNWLALLCLLSV